MSYQPANANGQATMANSSPVVIASDQSYPTLTKGTQGSTGFSVQSLKDGGRVLFSAVTDIAGVTAVTTEAMLTLVPTRAGVASSGATTFAVTSTKRLWITSITAGIITTSAAFFNGRFTLRVNPSGSAVATSPLICTIPISAPINGSGAGDQITVPFPDGIELSGSNQFGVSQIFSSVNGTVWVSVVGFEF